MPSAAYIAQRDAFNKQVQWLVEIDLDRCAEDYTTAPCTAVDQGDGDRCYYSFKTCQDIANYNKTTLTYRFCLNDVPWPDTATAVYPYLKKPVFVPQKIDPKRLIVFPEKLKISMIADYDPGAPDTDKTLYNTENGLGEFWRNLFVRNPNYINRPVRILRGFNASGFLLSDFEQVGPQYVLKGYDIRHDEVIIEAESPLADLDKQVIPFEISDDNVLQSSITDVATTMTVIDAGEYPVLADYTRAKIVVRVENEIMLVTNINTTTDVLTVTRGYFGTTAVAHNADIKVEHVAVFGSTTGTPQTVEDTILDLLDWAKVAAADIDTASLTAITDEVWPNSDVLRTVAKPQKISKLLQQLREIRSILIFTDSDGKFSASVVAPSTVATTLTDDHFIEGSVTIREDEDARITRVKHYYDPTDDASDTPEDFNKVVVVVSTELETVNNFGDVKDHVIYDHWTDPAQEVSRLRNIARRTITRRGFGVRTFNFKLEIGQVYNAGDEIYMETRHWTNTRAAIETRPGTIISKKETARAITEYSALDTNYNGRYLRIGPDTMTDDYDTASEEDRSYGYWGDADNRVGSIKEPGYVYW